MFGRWSQAPGAPNSISVGPLFTTLQITGPLTPGSAATLDIDAGAVLGGRTYVLAGSSCASPGIPLPLSGRVVDLCPGPLFDLSLTPGNPIFLGFSGNLGPGGQAQATILIPNLAALSGLALNLSGVVIDPLFIESIASIVDNRILTIN